jgi:hypothetical protein
MPGLPGGTPKPGSTRARRRGRSRTRSRGLRTRPFPNATPRASPLCRDRARYGAESISSCPRPGMSRPASRTRRRNRYAPVRATARRASSLRRAPEISARRAKAPMPFPWTPKALSILAACSGAGTSPVSAVIAVSFRGCHGHAAARRAARRPAGRWAGCGARTRSASSCRRPHGRDGGGADVDAGAEHLGRVVVP